MPRASDSAELFLLGQDLFIGLVPCREAVNLYDRVRNRFYQLIGKTGTIGTTGYFENRFKPNYRNGSTIFGFFSAVHFVPLLHYTEALVALNDGRW